MPEPGTALQIPKDVMADLLAAQAGSITTSQKLPNVLVMPAGVGLFEFPDEKRTADKFRGVVLNNHSRNVLWEREMGTPAEGMSEEDAKLPACTSNNGTFGIPRKGFAHAGLADGEVGDGQLTVACASCPYNQWGTGAMFIARKNAKGKAVTNQRAVYVLLEGKEIPYRLILSPISLQPFDQYLTTLLSRGLPVQAVVTEFTQEKIEQKGLKYAEIRFSMIETLSQEAFQRVMTKRSEWQKSIEPATETPTGAEPAKAGTATAAFDDFPAALDDEDDDLPF